VVSIPLVYVGGSARSGSTLLERMLAAVPGYFSVGEVVFIWERGLRRNDQCGCGERFADCPFWSQVGKSAFGGWDEVDVDEAIRLRTTVDRHRNIVRIGGLRPPGDLAPAIAGYRQLTASLYRAISEVSGAQVIIDSSKHVSYALLLRGLPELDLRLAHLVRRSHGVAYSWSRQVRKPGVGDGTSYMSVHGAAWVTGLWLTDNLLYEALRRRTSRSALVRYEDLAADPGAELARLITALGLPAEPRGLAALTEPGADPPVSHALSGNPMRQTQRRIVVRADEQWRTAMPRPRRAAITAATWPLLLRYRYPIAPWAKRQC
jgi:Sulfotransferase family